MCRAQIMSPLTWRGWRGGSRRAGARRSATLAPTAPSAWSPCAPRACHSCHRTGSWHQGQERSTLQWQVSVLRLPVPSTASVVCVCPSVLQGPGDGCPCRDKGDLSVSARGICSLLEPITLGMTVPTLPLLMVYPFRSAYKEPCMNWNGTKITFWIW